MARRSIADVIAGKDSQAVAQALTFTLGTIVKHNADDKELALGYIVETLRNIVSGEAPNPMGATWGMLRR